MNIGSVEAARGSLGQAVYKFGYNSAISTTEEVVWDGGNVYSYISTAATADNCKRSSTVMMRQAQAHERSLSRGWMKTCASIC